MIEDHEVNGFFEDNTFIRIILKNVFGQNSYSLYNDMIDIGGKKFSPFGWKKSIKAIMGKMRQFKYQIMSK